MWEYRVLCFDKFYHLFHFMFDFMFDLISYSLDPQVMIILILIVVQYSQNVFISFEKGSNH